MNDLHHLQRFLSAQDGIYETVLDELQLGRKRTHWMWFIFPQLQGLGLSETARRYAIASAEEAVAFSQHLVLGSRLRECTSLVNGVKDRSAEQVFGYPDYLKFRSCMTLFQRCAEDNHLFQEALDKYFGGNPDSKTLDLLEQPG